MNWYIEVIKKYAEFSGRARRSEYWYFVLFNIIISVALALLSLVPLLSIIYILYSLAILVPSLGVLVRRLHDTNRSGWNFLFVLIPLVGAIILLVFLATEGDRGPNKYGPDPKSAMSNIGDPTIIDSNVV